MVILQLALIAVSLAVAIGIRTRLEDIRMTSLPDGLDWGKIIHPLVPRYSDDLDAPGAWPMLQVGKKPEPRRRRRKINPYEQLEGMQNQLKALPALQAEVLELRKELASRTAKQELVEPVQASVRHAHSGTLEDALANEVAQSKRYAYPKRIILVRHGESEGNVNHTIYSWKADNQIELTEKGSAQAIAVGKRIKVLLKEDEKVVVHVSPFQRTLQTERNLRTAFEDQIVFTHIDPRLREQEFGNIQGVNFKKFWQERKKVGRFYYRFPTGESASDVYLRTLSWWHEVLEINLARASQVPVGTVVVVTHGLTMRLILMQMNMWSPNTFKSIFNAGNCEMWVFNKNLSRNDESAYDLPSAEGDLVKSSLEVRVTFKNGSKTDLDLNDYLSIPVPRTKHFSIAAKMLAAQHGIEQGSVYNIDFFDGRFSKYK